MRKYFFLFLFSLVFCAGATAQDRQKPSDAPSPAVIAYENLSAQVGLLREAYAAQQPEQIVYHQSQALDAVRLEIWQIEQSKDRARADKMDALKQTLAAFDQFSFHKADQAAANEKFAVLDACLARMKKDL